LGRTDSQVKINGMRVELGEVNRYCGVTVVLLWCYCGVTVVLLWCYCGVTVVLLWCYCGVTVVLLWCYSGVTVVLLWCYCGVTLVLLWRCYGIVLLGRTDSQVKINGMRVELGEVNCHHFKHLAIPLSILKFEHLNKTIIVYTLCVCGCVCVCVGLFCWAAQTRESRSTACGWS
jgi:hypothetical protein